MLAIIPKTLQQSIDIDVLAPCQLMRMRGWLSDIAVAHRGDGIVRWPRHYLRRRHAYDGRYHLSMRRRSRSASSTTKQILARSSRHLYPSCLPRNVCFRAIFAAQAVNCCRAMSTPAVARPAYAMPISMQICIVDNIALHQRKIIAVAYEHATHRGSCKAGIGSLIMITTFAL